MGISVMAAVGLSYDSHSLGAASEVLSRFVRCTRGAWLCCYLLLTDRTATSAAL